MPNTSAHARPRQLAHLFDARATLLLAATIGLSLTTPVLGRGGAAPAGDQEALLRAGQPLALTAADFDEDGVPDLLTGHASGSGGILTLHRGNGDAIYANTPAARSRRRAQGTVAPFRSGARIVALPGPPELLFTGDFDADGHIDVLAAAPGLGAAVLRGDGAGALARPQVIPLPGTLTAVAVGDLNGPDGLADVAFAVTTRSGPRVLVYAGYDGAWTATPQLYQLSAPATALEIAALDRRHGADLAVAAGQELLLIHGRGRIAPDAPAAASAAIERHALPFAVHSMAAGDFSGDGRADLAVNAADGTVRVLVQRAGPVDRASSRSTTAGAAAETTFAEATIALGTAPGRLVRGGRNGRGHDLLALDRAAGELSFVGSGNARRAQPVIAGTAVLPMRLDGDARDELVVLRPGEAAPAVLGAPAAVTRVVTNTNDSGPGSLRQAILDGNATPGDDLITFNIPGPPPHTIVPITPLPPLVQDESDSDGDATVIDATTEPDFAGTPVVELSGALVGASGNGITIGSPACVVRGLVINRFAAGVLFSYLLDRSRGVENGIVEGNYIGTDVGGTVALGNGRGVDLGWLTEGAGFITIGGTAAAARNVISANTHGIIGRTTGPILGNFIGTDATGTRGLGNIERAIDLTLSTPTIGSLVPGGRNIIAASGSDGIRVYESGLLLIAGNYIGTDITGTLPLGNGGDGVRSLDSRGVLSQNVVSANAGLGMHADSSFSQWDVLDNRIGTNAAGTAALGNGQGGALMRGFGYNVRGNLLSGNGGFGIQLNNGPDQVFQNFVGTDITGTLPLGNQGDGIDVQELSMTIGGEGENVGNIIAFNGGRGVALPLQVPANLTLLSNSIHSNGGLGIDLGGDGVTPNDACDVDEQANAPVLSGVSGSPTAVTVTGSMNSLASRSYLLQFFASPAADPSGYGEGQTLLGSANVTTDANCNANFSVTLPVAVEAGQFITATATRALDQEGRRPTSEFSNARQFVPQQTPVQGIRSLIQQVATLVDSGELKGAPGIVLHVKLRLALLFAERNQPRLAAQQLRGFVDLVELLVRLRFLGGDNGRALTGAAQSIIEALQAS